MRLVVAGGGYVGLATATGFARQGHRVDVVEIDHERARLLNEGILPFQEPSLVDAFRQQVLDSAIVIHDGYEGLSGHVDFAFVCTSTPQTHHGSLDTSQVFRAAEMLIESCPEPLRLIVRSTVNPGTVGHLQGTPAVEASGAQVMMNPEFLREGCALQDFEAPSRIVIGGRHEDALDALYDLYSFSDAPLIRTDAKTAELIKLASNAALAVRVSMVNEIAQVAQWEDADVECLLRGIGSDPRIGPDYLKPGLGFGGSCLPKDLEAFRSTALQTGLSTPVFDGASLTNSKAIGHLASRVIETARSLSEATVSIIGVGFKPGSDSLRNSQAVRLIWTLLNRNFRITVYDPLAEDNARREFGDHVSYAATAEEAVEQSSVVVVLDHGLFDGSDMERHEQVLLNALGKPMGAATRVLEVASSYGR